MSAAKRPRKQQQQQSLASFLGLKEFPEHLATAAERDPRDSDAKFDHGGLRRDLDHQLVPVRVHLQQHPEVATKVRVRRVACVPPSALSTELDKLLTAAATITPKPKKFGNKLQNPPWPLYVREPSGAMCLPRYFALRVFGPTAAFVGNISVYEGEPLSDGARTPQIPLRTAADCVGNDNVNQELLVDTVVQSLQQQVRQHKFGGALVCMPPGKGKTACALHIIARLGRKALFVVPNLSLIPQTMKEAQAFLGPDCRVGSLHTSVAKKHDYKNKDVVVCCMRSLAMCDYSEILPEFGTVVVDEAHETATQEYSKLYMRLACMHQVGLTATPERADETGGILEWLIGPIVWFTPLKLQETRWGQLAIVCHKLQYPPEAPLRLAYQMVCGERKLDQENLYAQLTMHAGRTNWLREFVMALAAQGRQILCLGQRICLMKNLYQQLKDHGIDVGLLVGESNADTKMTMEERDQVRACQVRIFTDSIGYKALNVKELDTLVVLDPPIGGIDSWLQRLGRITRDHDKPMPKIHLLLDMGVPEFESRVQSVVRKLQTFESEAFTVEYETHPL